MVKCPSGIRTTSLLDSQSPHKHAQSRISLVYLTRIPAHVCMMTATDSPYLSTAELAQPQRQQLLLERINQEGRVTAARIAAELRVSEDTIRRDLRELADAGLVQRFHGGAIRRSTVAAGFVDRLGDRGPEKA